MNIILSEDDHNEKTLSLSEIEKKLQDAMEAVEILKKGGNITVGGESFAKKYDELKKHSRHCSIWKDVNWRISNNGCNLDKQENL